MIEGITLAFAVGLFAVVCPGAVAFAVALVGLRVASALHATAVMAACFGVIFAVAGVAFALLDLEWVLDVAAWIAAAAGMLLVLAGVRAAAGGERGERAFPAAVYGTVSAIAALPSILMVFDSMIRQGVEASGAAAAVVATIAFAAGCAATLALPALAASALTSAGPAARRAAGVLVAGAGAWIVVYWLPALLGGATERGGALEGATNDIASSITQFAARYELGFALVLLAVAIAALATAARPRPG